MSVSHLNLWWRILCCVVQMKWNLAIKNNYKRLVGIWCRINRIWLSLTPNLAPVEPFCKCNLTPVWTSCLDKTLIDPLQQEPHDSRHGLAFVSLSPCDLSQMQSQKYTRRGLRGGAYVLNGTDAQRWNSCMMWGKSTQGSSFHFTCNNMVFLSYIILYLCSYYYGNYLLKGTKAIQYGSHTVLYPLVTFQCCSVIIYFITYSNYISLSLGPKHIPE